MAAKIESGNRLDAEERSIKFRVAPTSNNEEKKRRFVLITRRVVTIKKTEEQPPVPHPPEIKKHRSPEIKKSSYTKARKFPIKISHRICQVCQLLKPISEVTMLTSDNEKMFVLLSAIFRMNLPASSTTRIYKNPAVHVCTTHVTDTSAEVFSMFCGAPKSGKARQRKLLKVGRFASFMTEREFTPRELRESASQFLLKYPDRSAVVGPMIKEEDIPVEETVECPTLLIPEQIVPKCFRQPRKQRFEQEEEKTSSILRIIEKETFNLPTQSPVPVNRSLVNPLQCCYCLEVHEKNTMLQVPKTENRIVKWVLHLGSAFRERLQRNPINFMCRRHFSKDSFSSRGRLLKNAVPNVIPVAKIHTYKIEGNDFVEVNENDMDEGCDDDSEVDIEN